MTRRSSSEKSPPALIEPISVRIPVAVAMTGFSRSRLYELIKIGELEIAKDGASTLVLVDSLNAAVRRRVVARNAGAPTR